MTSDSSNTRARSLRMPSEAGAGGSYSLGDSDLAAERLELLADTFAASTERFLQTSGPATPRLAVDLGCGPGRTTMLLQSILHPLQTVAIDSSPAYVDLARQRIGDVVDVVRGDALDLPTSVADADVIFARFLLGHLGDPLRAIAHWGKRLSACGVILLDEVESITTAEPTFRLYLDLQRLMLEANGGYLEIGPYITSACERFGDVQSSTLSIVTPPSSAVARMFALNLAVFRERPEVADLATTHELDELASGLRCLAMSQTGAQAITWQLRQIVVTRSPAQHGLDVF